MNRWYFWVLAPIMLATGLGLPLIVEPPTVQGTVVLYLFCGALVLATLGLANADRFEWALRVVAGLIFLAYAAYASSELLAWWQGKPAHPRPGRNTVNLHGALSGLFIIGLPSLYFLLRGRSGTVVDDFLDPDGNSERLTSGESDPRFE
jgi:uncharacterized protein (DUF58 family)